MAVQLSESQLARYIDGIRSDGRVISQGESRNLSEYLNQNYRVVTKIEAYNPW